MFKHTLERLIESQDTIREAVGTQIHDLVNCVAYFAYVNRVVAGLGVIPGGREGKPGQ